MRRANDPGNFTLDDVLDLDDARDAVRKASTIGALAEQERIDASKAYAEAEREYRKALSTEIVRLHSSEKVAWTACGELARGDDRVADLKYERDVAHGILEVAEQRAFRLQADRKALLALMSWSERQSLAMLPGAPEPQWTPRAA